MDYGAYRVLSMIPLDMTLSSFCIFVLYEPSGFTIRLFRAAGRNASHTCFALCSAARDYCLHAGTSDVFIWEDPAFTSVVYFG